MMDFDIFCRYYKNNIHSWCTSNFVILVLNNHSYRIKLLPYRSFYGDHVHLRKIEPPFVAVCLKKKTHTKKTKTKPPGCPFSSILLKMSNFICHEVCKQHSTLKMCINWLSKKVCAVYIMKKKEKKCLLSQYLYLPQPYNVFSILFGREST